MTEVTERNKDLIRRLLAEVDRGNLDVVDDCYAPDYVDHTPSPLRAQAIYRIVDGRIVERWTEHGRGILEQLGIAPERR